MAGTTTEKSLVHAYDETKKCIFAGYLGGKNTVDAIRKANLKAPWFSKGFSMKVSLFF